MLANGQVKRKSADNNLYREVFKTSRLMEFYSEKELAMQIGHAKNLWLVALIKELIDNGLDACEGRSIHPWIRLAIEPHAVTVQDNGPGLPTEVLKQSLDFTIRVSDKAHYVSPTRGQLGNALKCVWAAPFVVDGKHGRVEVESFSNRHIIDVTVDRIRQEPHLDYRPETIEDGGGAVKNGTKLKMHWPEVASFLSHAKDPTFYRARHLIREFATFNPHGSFELEYPGGTVSIAAAAQDWKKWSPSSHTCPYWYTTDHLGELITAKIARELDGAPRRSLRDFLEEFNGLSSTRKRKEVLETAGLPGLYLQDLAPNGEIDSEAIARLLVAMQKHTNRVQPESLGMLGKAHMTNALVTRYDVAEGGIRYKRVTDFSAGVPFVLEVAGGQRNEDDRLGRNVIVGVNFSPAIISPFEELNDLLGEMRIDEDDDFVLLVHLAWIPTEYPIVNKNLSFSCIPAAFSLYQLYLLVTLS